MTGTGAKGDQELLVLVDDDDQIIGTAPKLDAHQAGALHRAFSIIVWNSAKRLLLQKRQAGKYHSGGLWTNTCCGHPRPGEDVADAARRRLDEEMGFSCPLTNIGTIRYRAALDLGLTEHEIVHIFHGLYDGTVAPNPAEADGYQWARIEDVETDVAAMPRRFSVWFREYVAAEWPLLRDVPEGR
jgi:isopentenyl-diphosphate delta-isomerase